MAIYHHGKQPLVENKAQTRDEQLWPFHEFVTLCTK